MRHVGESSWVSLSRSRSGPPARRQLLPSQPGHVAIWHGDIEPGAPYLRARVGLQPGGSASGPGRFPRGANTGSAPASPAEQDSPAEQMRGAVSSQYHPAGGWHSCRLNCRMAMSPSTNGCKSSLLRLNGPSAAAGRNVSHRSPKSRPGNGGLGFPGAAAQTAR